MTESPVQDGIRQALAEGGELSIRQLTGEDVTRERAIRKGLDKMRDRGEVVSRKEGAILMFQLNEPVEEAIEVEEEAFVEEEIPALEEVLARFGGWTEDEGPIVDIWHDHLRKPGHRCLWSVRWISNATPKYPPPQDMTLEQALYELRDIHDRHEQLMGGSLVLPQGQRRNWDNPEAYALYEAIQADGNPRLSELGTRIGQCRQHSPEYVMYAEPGQPSLWPLGDQGSLFLGFVRFRPGWPAPGKNQDWANEAKVASQTGISPQKAKQISLAKSRTMGFLDGS